MATRVKPEPAAAPSDGKTATVERAEATRTHWGPVSFPELVWAHFVWQREVHRKDGLLHGEAELDFQRLLVRFQHEQGEIRNAYWCTREASAVALTTQRPHGRMGRLLRMHPMVRLHSATDWVTRDQPEIAGLLHRCNAMSVKIGELLRHGTQQIAMERVLAIAGRLLGFADAPTPRTKQETRELVEETEAELEEVQAYYERAGTATGRIVFFWGMMTGLAALAAIALAAGLLLWATGDLDWDDPATRNLFASYALGAIGAVASVLTRMASGKKSAFYVDFEVGRAPLRRLGSFRPLVGAVFALILYFALESGLVQLGPESDGDVRFEYYAVLSFFAGFSERWVRGVLSPVAQLAGGDDAEPAAAETKETPKAAEED